MAFILHTDGTLEETKPKNGTDFQLEELQKIVGGLIEIVSYLTIPGKIMVIDEEGKLKEKPLNHVASLLYLGFPPDPIVGTALLCLESEIQ